MFLFEFFDDIVFMLFSLLIMFDEYIFVVDVCFFGFEFKFWELYMFIWFWRIIEFDVVLLLFVILSLLLNVIKI